MKQMRKYFYKAIVISVALFTASGLVAQEKSINETFSWTKKVDKDAYFSFRNYNCDLVIHTTDASEVVYKMTVDAGFKSVEDAGKMKEKIEDMKIVGSGSNAEFDNVFWESRNEAMGKKTMELKGGDKITYSDFDIRGEIWIPAGCNFRLTSRYSNIEIDNLRGSMELKLYNDKVFTSDVAGNIKIEAKYSNLEFGNIKNIRGTLYSTNIETLSTGDLELSSKYSKFNSGDAGKININGYNDKYSFANTGDIHFNDKYSDLRVLDTGNFEADCYNSNIVAGNIKDADLKSKYTKYDIKGAGNVKISGSYNDNFKFEKLESIDIHGTRYGSYKVDKLETSVKIDESYSDKLEILDLGTGFRSLDINGRYTKVEINPDELASYVFKADVRYPHFSINEEDLNIIKDIKDSSKREVEAVKGEKKEGTPVFSVIGYDFSFKIID